MPWGDTPYLVCGGYFSDGLTGALAGDACVALGRHTLPVCGGCFSDGLTGALAGDACAALGRHTLPCLRRLLLRRGFRL
ncbi:hypothetical protein [Kingella potus]|uniref:hypothetical protein n=1 Tax=Kingella potus TaxID=265175 RepID=UPI001FD083A7|nr:hypothetical protein [Kingella potus]UOP01463.1 hypothetical protein LVJ84_04485 [Kingella potus]